MSELLYGIVNAEGNLVAVSTNPKSVATEANRIAKGKEVVDMDGLLHPKRPEP